MPIIIAKTTCHFCRADQYQLPAVVVSFLIIPKFKHNYVILTSFVMSWNMYQTMRKLVDFVSKISMLKGKVYENAGFLSIVELKENWYIDHSLTLTASVVCR